MVLLLGGSPPSVLGSSLAATEVAILPLVEDRLRSSCYFSGDSEFCFTAKEAELSTPPTGS